MDDDLLLINSTLCRLCSEENKNGIDIYGFDENAEDVCSLINKYLPVKVEHEDLYPKKICPGCHIQLEATKLFMDLIIDGQQKLRAILQSQQELLQREEKERLRLEQVLHNHNPNASVETYSIQSDENGEKYIIQIYSEGPLFSSEHPLSLKAEGLEKPKRKRGRPPKALKTEEETSESQPLPTEDEVSEPIEDATTIEDPNARKKRKIRPPARYEGGLQDPELVKILKTEGAIEGEPDTIDEVEPDTSYIEPAKNSPQKTVVGKMVTKDDEGDSEELIFMTAKPFKRKKQKFMCDICNKEFQSKRRCDLHKKRHNIQFRCLGEDCSVQDVKREVIAEHQKETGHEGISAFELITSLGGTVYLSNINQPTNDDSSSTIEEDKQNVAVEYFKCQECDKKFSCKQNHDVHMKAVHAGEKPYSCNLCKKEFSYACALKKHMIVHRNDTSQGLYNELFYCDICNKFFQHPSSFMYHKESEHGNKKFVCNTCNKSFKHRQILLRHQLVHSEERPFKCGDCDKQFKTKASLSNHEEIHKGVKKFVCPICATAFLHKTSLWMHLKWHDGKKPHICEICNKAFAQKGNMLEHQRIHTGEKPFTCNLCGRKFTTSSQCKLHMKRHTGEKPYECKFCKKRFLHKDTYDVHIRRHLDERPYHCRFCTKSFPEQWACTRHERIHLGVKKYVCDVCNKAFSDGANFTKHKRTHLKNGIKPDTLDRKPEEQVVDNHQIVEEPQISTIEFITAASEDSTQNDMIQNPSEISNIQFMDEENPDDINSKSLRIHDLLDTEGNAISITTADGQPIPIVSAGNEKLQGLLPDGTLVSLDIPLTTQDEQKEGEDELTEELESVDPEVSLLNTEIQFLEDNSISDPGASLSQAKPAFLSEDGKVCFITGFDENAFLTIT